MQRSFALDASLCRIEPEAFELFTLFWLLFYSFSYEKVFCYRVFFFFLVCFLEASERFSQRKIINRNKLNKKQINCIFVWILSFQFFFAATVLSFQLKNKIGYFSYFFQLIFSLLFSFSLLFDLIRCFVFLFATASKTHIAAQNIKMKRKKCQFNVSTFIKVLFVDCSQ